MLVMVHFVMANTVFMHTHRCFDGHTVTHSHPYLPSAHHTQSQQALDSLSIFNAVAGSMDVSPYVSVADAESAFTVIADKCLVFVTVAFLRVSGLRDPPRCML